MLFEVFVTLESGKECVTVIEFDSFIESKYIIKDGVGEDYHTTVTIFLPMLSAMEKHSIMRNI